MKKVYGGVLEGIKVRTITIETDISQGTPNIIIVGLADKAVSESKERIRCCLNLIKFSIKKITVSLSPADIKKTGAALDLSIFIGIISEKITLDFEKFIWFGELGLDGKIKKSIGILATCIDAYQNNKIVICSVDSELESLPYCNYIFINSIFEIFTNEFIEKCNNFQIIHRSQDISLVDKINKLLNTNINEDILLKYNLTDLYNWLLQEFDPFDHIYEQDMGKLAIILSAIGGHHCLFVGPQGVGKSLLCKSITKILPPLTQNELLESSTIYNISQEYLSNNRPFRTPHSGCSLAALTGSAYQPGEISLAHNGVLFLDELPEYSPNVIESLKVPLEEKKIHISRAMIKDIYPANIILLASMNPCKCGLYFTKKCICSKNYIQKISAPIIDRLDMLIILENTFTFNKTNYFNCHRNIFKSYIKKKHESMIISPEVLHTAQNLINKHHLSLRSLDKILSLAHTFACYENMDISIHHVYAVIMLRKAIK